jgi:hypothetical protein
MAERNLVKVLIMSGKVVRNGTDVAKLYAGVSSDNLYTSLSSPQYMYNIADPPLTVAGTGDRHTGTRRHTQQRIQRSIYVCHRHGIQGNTRHGK